MKKNKHTLSILLLLCLMMNTLLTGCSSKKTITSDTFISCLEAKDYDIQDNSATFEAWDYIQDVQLATKSVDSKTTSIEFLDIDNSSNANMTFELMKGSSEAYPYEGKRTTSNVEIGNYKKYTVKADGEYTVIIQVDDTLIHVLGYQNNEDEINSIIDELGY